MSFFLFLDGIAVRHGVPEPGGHSHLPHSEHAGLPNLTELSFQ